MAVNSEIIQNFKNKAEKVKHIKRDMYVNLILIVNEKQLKGFLIKNKYVQDTRWDVFIRCVELLLEKVDYKLLPEDKLDYRFEEIKDNDESIIYM